MRSVATIAVAIGFATAEVAWFKSESRNIRNTQQLLVPPYRQSTVGRRSFSVAASTFWNTLPNDIQSAPSLSSFRRQLKTFLFHHSFPDIIL